MAVLAVAGSLGLAGQAFGRTVEAPPSPSATYLVQPGDTLWGLARSRVGPAGDPRPLVDLIRERNGMAASALQVGDRLWLPAP